MKDKTTLFCIWGQNINVLKKLICKVITHSMPSMNGVSLQSFSGKRCNIIPLLIPLPTKQ